MKHASSAKIAKIEKELAELRKRTGLTEKKPGAFYRKGEALLKFEKDSKGPYAALKSGRNWVKLRLETQTEWNKLFAELDKALAKPKAKGAKS
jgi:hypothetical protein